MRGRFFSYVTQFVVWVLCRCTAEGALLKVGRGCRASSSANLGSCIYGRSSTCSRPIRQALSYLALSCPYVHAIYTLAFGTHLRARGSPQTAQSPQRAYISHLADLSLGSVPPLGFTTVTYFWAELAHAVLPRLGVAGLQSFQEALGAGALR